jgi:hypothetical protein
LLPLRFALCATLANAISDRLPLNVDVNAPARPDINVHAVPRLLAVFGVRLTGRLGGRPLFGRRRGFGWRRSGSRRLSRRRRLVAAPHP